jgi:hypothetical protein
MHSLGETYLFSATIIQWCRSKPSSDETTGICTCEEDSDRPREHRVIIGGGLVSPQAGNVYFAKFNQVKRRGELIFMNSRNHVNKSAVEAGKGAAFILLAALTFALPLQSQQSAIDDSTTASGSVSQSASAVSKQAQQVDQDPSGVKKRIEQRAEKSPIDPTTVALDGGAPAASSSNAGNPDPEQTAPAPSGQSPVPNDHTLTGNFFHRLAQFYSQDWAGTNPAGPSVTKRGLPAPVDSPPFPFSDWDTEDRLTLALRTAIPIP